LLLLLLADLVVHEQVQSLVDLQVEALVAVDASCQVMQGQRHNHTGDLGRHVWLLLHNAKPGKGLIQKLSHIVKNECAKQLLSLRIVGLAVVLACHHGLEPNCVGLNKHLLLKFLS